ncbi:hypothetical protein N1851_022776 [Merluccius polli]|uniref:Uncharacterized protein n=1 Tax=Merluccius polli TaxID=89951 RepID=A0AA47NVL6_MERPO|nr:hypothetical protein N1851_022776 [Merluccius polli]
MGTCKAVGMKQQGAWIRWENVVERKVTELWKAKLHHKCLIRAVYNVLPSPSNLPTWVKAESLACPLFSKRGTLEHNFSCYTKALREGL